MLENLLNTYGDAEVLAALGLIVGLLFGASAQHSRFCLRAATAEVGGGQAGPRLGVWLIVFASALILTQGAVVLGWLETADTRQIAGLGSLSGAVIGGLMFGAGMILARGCASRLLVLSATGNMRALVTGLVLTIVAQAAYRGALAPAREQLFNIWTIEGGAARDLLAVLGVGHGAGLALGAVMMLAGLVLVRRHSMTPTRVWAAFGVGIAVALGWVGTYAVAQLSFEPVSVSSVTFTGPSTDTLMALINERGVTLSFSLGLVPGVFLGSGLISVLTREFKLQRFDASTGMERYLIGAILMGFGSMLAGGCAVGAGVSGGAIFALTAWLAVFCMWIGALTTSALMPLIEGRRAAQAGHPG